MAAAVQLIDHSEQERAVFRQLHHVQTERANHAAELARLQQCLDDYGDLSRSLRTLPERVERQILVPHGKLAFFPGKLYPHGFGQRSSATTTQRP